MNRSPQFRMEVRFHFQEHGADRRRWFLFGEDCHRRVPLEMEGVEGLNTVGMWVEQPQRFEPGDTIAVDCRVIAPELFEGIIQPGSRGRLWDGGFFADVTVTEVCNDNWR